MVDVWGGIEGTLNRVGDRYFDQLMRSGHRDRLHDLDRIAALGIRTVRVPIVWEYSAPDDIERADWSWADAYLRRMRALGLHPIVGLVHHGSGPRATSLLDAGFATGLATYAAAFARRYPWVTQYTPVNEPLTTARFSGLYGHWYPHQRDEAAMAQMVLHQCRAVVMAMAAIRQVNPSAQLIQTEDLGKTHSTPALAYQADFENERRWCSLDLLCGTFDEAKPYWRHLRSLGISGTDLAWFTAHPCPPDVIGINHYLTSERFLDEDIEHYPVATWGGNGRDRYADVEAVRVGDVELARHDGLLRETWVRYQRPIALTEVHLGCDDEAERLRWLWEAWTAAQTVQAAGMPMRAITVWALLGSFDWNRLVTRDEGYYEPGAFDVRTSPLRLTTLGKMVRQLIQRQSVPATITQVPGWWRRPERVYYRLTQSV